MPLISATRQRGIVDVQDFPGATAPVHGIHQRGGVTGQRLRRLKLGTRTREGHGGQPAQGGFGRRANGPAVKDVHTLVRAVVDAHDDQIRRLRQERGQGELHAVHGRPRDRRAAEAGLLHRVQAQGIVQGDGTAHARLLRERGDHVQAHARPRTARRATRGDTGSGCRHRWKARYARNLPKQQKQFSHRKQTESRSPDGPQAFC